MWNLHFPIWRFLWRPSWILAQPSWKYAKLDWLRKNIQIAYAREHFYQVSCLYLHVPFFCHFPLCLTYEFGSHLEISVSHLENGKNCDGFRENIYKKGLKNIIWKFHACIRKCMIVSKTDISRSTIKVNYYLGNAYLKHLFMSLNKAQYPLISTGSWLKPCWLGRKASTQKQTFSLDLIFRMRKITFQFFF